MASSYQEDHVVDARVKSRFSLKGFSIPGPYEQKSNTTYVPARRQMGIASLKTRPSPNKKAAVPIAGQVSAALVSKPGAHEHVFVDPSTQAVGVRCHLTPRLHNRQD